jgi:hypothetical protein
VILVPGHQRRERELQETGIDGRLVHRWLAWCLLRRGSWDGRSCVTEELLEGAAGAPEGTPGAVEGFERGGVVKVEPGALRED